MPSSSSRFTAQDIEYLREQILGEPYSFPTAMGSYITNTVATNPPTLHLDDIYDGRPEYGTTLPNNPYNGYEFYHVLDATNNVIAFKRYSATDAAWEVIGGAGEIPRVTTLPGSPATGELVFHVVDATNVVVQLKRYSGSVWEVISEGLPPRVTSLPSSPTDGQVAYHVIETTNNVIHSKRYRTSTATWETFGHTPPPLVTSLPGSPGDGEEVCYVADGSNRIIWHLRYNSAGGTYKWEFIGGSPMWAEVTTQESTSSTSYTALATAGPSIALPLAGDYMVAIGAGIQCVGGGGVIARMSYDIGATGAVDADSCYMALTNTEASVFRERRKAGLSAVTLTAKYKAVAAGPSYWADRWIRVIPIKVA